MYIYRLDLVECRHERREGQGGNEIESKIDKKRKSIYKCLYGVGGGTHRRRATFERC